MKLRTLVTEATSSVIAGAGWGVSCGTAGGGLTGASSAMPFSFVMLFSTMAAASGSGCKKV